MVAALVDLHPLGNAREHPVFDLAHAARHRAELRHGVAHPVADHGVAVLIVVRAQKLIDRAERRAAVEIVGVDDRERPVQHVPAAGNGLSRAPGLDASVRDRISRRDIRQLLIDVFDMEKPLHAGPDALPEERLVLTLDNKDKITEACASCVVHGKIDNTVSFPVDRLHLLEPAEAAAHSGGHDDELRCLFLHRYASCKLLSLWYRFPREIASPFHGKFCVRHEWLAERAPVWYTVLNLKSM